MFAFLSRRWGLALTLLAAAIGLAGVWAGVHCPGDIAAGAAIGFLAVGVITTYTRMNLMSVTVPE